MKLITNDNCFLEFLIRDYRVKKSIYLFVMKKHSVLSAISDIISKKNLNEIKLDERNDTNVFGYFPEYSNNYINYFRIIYMI